MSCARLEEVLSETPSAEARAHAVTCPDCGPALQAFDVLGQVAEPAPAPAAALEALKALSAQELRERPRARPWWVEALVLSGANAMVAVGASMAMSWHQSQHASLMWRWGAAGALGLLAVVGGWIAVVPQAKRVRSGALLFTAACALVAVLCGSGDAGGQAFAAGIGCATTECAISVVPMLVAGWVMTRFSSSGLRVWLAGASVGAAGMLALHLHCPNGSAAHLATFHVAPWLMLCFAGVAARRFLPTFAHAP